MKKILCIIVVFSSPVLYAQNLDTLDLFTCLRSTAKNYPANQQKQLYNEIYLLKKSNYNSKWLPSLNVEGKATYQSDVVTIDMNQEIADIVNIPIPPHDNFNLYIDINQMIYDGGFAKHNKTNEAILLQNRLNEVDIQLYKVNEKVESIYFALLLTNKNIHVVNETLLELNTRKRMIESGIANGTLSPSDKDMIQSQIIKIELALDEIKAKKESLVSVLANFTDLGINTNTIFSIPNTGILQESQSIRPEKLMFETQRERLQNTQKLLTAQKLPHVYAFSRLGYGKPGLNMLGTEFDSYYIVGAGFSWNIIDWNYIKKEKEMLYVQSKIVDSKEESFDKNIDISLEYNLAEKTRLTESIAKQEELIKLTENILNNSRSQLKNGIITTTDYLSQVNNNLRAKIELESKKILLIQNKIEYLHITGLLYSLIESEK